MLRVPDVAIALLRLEDAGCKKCTVAEDRDGRPVVLDAADADRNLQVEVNGREPVHDRLDRLEIGIRVKDCLRDQHREAVRANAPVGRPRIRAVVAAQHAADAHQELIALRHAVEAVQELEVAEIQTDHEVGYARILLHDAARLPVEAVLIVDACQVVVHRAEVLEVHVLLILCAVTDQEVHADFLSLPIVERVAADLERGWAARPLVLLKPDGCLRTPQGVLLEPVRQDGLKFLQIIGNRKEAECLTVRVDAVLLCIKPDDAGRQVLHGHAQRLSKGPLVKSVLQYRMMSVSLHSLAPLYVDHLDDTRERRVVRAQDLNGTRGDEIQVAVFDLRLTELHACLERTQARAVAAAVCAAPDRIAARPVFI